MSKQSEAKCRKEMSNDFICGYFSAIADMTHSISTVKASFDMESFQARASQKVEKQIKRKGDRK